MGISPILSFLIPYAKPLEKTGANPLAPIGAVRYRPL